MLIDFTMKSTQLFKKINCLFDFVGRYFQRLYCFTTTIIIDFYKMFLVWIGCRKVAIKNAVEKKTK